MLRSDGLIVLAITHTARARAQKQDRAEKEPAERGSEGAKGSVGRAATVPDYSRALDVHTLHFRAEVARALGEHSRIAD